MASGHGRIEVFNEDDLNHRSSPTMNAIAHVAALRFLVVVIMFDRDCCLNHPRSPALARLCWERCLIVAGDMLNGQYSAPINGSR